MLPGSRPGAGVLREGPLDGYGKSSWGKKGGEHGQGQMSERYLFGDTERGQRMRKALPFYEQCGRGGWHDDSSPRACSRFGGGGALLDPNRPE